MSIFTIVARIVMITSTGRFHVAEFDSVRSAFDTYVQLVDEGVKHVELHTYGVLDPLSHTWEYKVAEAPVEFEDTTPLAEWELEIL